MNRRGFIIKIIASLAALPVVGKLAQAKTNKVTLTTIVGEPDPSVVPVCRWRVGDGKGGWGEWQTLPLQMEMTSPRVDLNNVAAGSRR